MTTTSIASPFRLPQAILVRLPALAAQRTGRTVASFVVVVVLFAVYRLGVTPMVEPQQDPDQRVAGSGQFQSGPPQRLELQALFDPGDWELSSPKVLETDSARLLLRDYTNLEDGRVEVRPCTMIFMSSDEELDERERIRRAVVLQAPEGAILQFDRPLDLRSAKIGKLVGGRLVGQVTIRSDQRSPEPDDDLWIETSEVDMSAHRVATAEAVRFRMGGSYGSGNGMHMELIPGVDRGSGPSVDGLKWLELKRDVRMHLEFAGASLLPSDMGAAAGANVATPNQTANQQAAAPTNGAKSDSSDEEQAPIEVASRGPFRFDLAGKMATFDDEVDVIRVNPDGPSDQLSCARLAIHFVERADEKQPKPGSPKKRKKGNRDKKSKRRRTPKLEATRLVATGTPVVIRSPSDALEARGEQLVYDLKQRKITLTAAEQISVRQRQRELHTASLELQANAEGEWNSILAQGPGWLRGDVSRDSQGDIAKRNRSQGSDPLQLSPRTTAKPPKAEVVEARWKKSLQLAPEGELRLLSIVGDAWVRSPEMGSLSAQSIHVWLREVAKKKAPESDAARPKKSGSSASRRDIDLVPDRMLAEQQVEVDSTELLAFVERMEIWFEGMERLRDRDEPQVTSASHLQSPGPARQPAARGHVVNPELRVGAQRRVALRPLLAAARPSQRPKDRFRIDGKLLQAQVRELGGKAHLSEAIVTESVRLAQLIAQPSEDKPLLVTGDRVHLVQPHPEQAEVRVDGKPAEIDGRGMRLIANQLELNTATNQVDVNVPGRMRMIVDRDQDNKPIAPQPLDVTWEGSMHFDGLVASFERQVMAHMPDQRLHTDQLEVTLTQRIEFGKSQSSQAPKNDVRRMVCRRGVYLERWDRTPGKAAHQRAHMTELTLDQQTGRLQGAGPGWVSVVQQGAQRLAPTGTGATSASPAVTLGRSQPAQQPDKQSNELTFLRVNFARQLSGNMRQQFMIFSDDVRTIYGPVTAWNEELEADDPQQLGEDAMLLNCDRLTVNTKPGTLPNQKQTFEMAAEGHALVEGREFTARAARLTYDQSKSLLVLDGDGRSNAELWEQKGLGVRRSRTAARKILYWRTDPPRVLFDGVESGELSQMKGGR